VQQKKKKNKAAFVVQKKDEPEDNEGIFIPSNEAFLQAPGDFLL